MPAILLRVQSTPQSRNIWVVCLKASHACQSVSVIVCPESYLAYAARIFCSSPAHGAVVSPLWYSGVTHTPTEPPGNFDFTYLPATSPKCSTDGGYSKVYFRL